MQATARGSMSIVTRTPDIAPVTGGVLLFRSCLVSAEYPGAEAATKWLFERFGIEYTVHPEQTCCTGLGYYSELVPVATSVALAARNACVAVDDGHPVMSYLCSTCYAINKKARNILNVPEHREAANRTLAKVGRAYTDDVAGAIHHSHTHGDPVERASLHPRHDRAPPRRHQGRHAPRLPLLQGVPGRGGGRQPRTS